MNIFNFTKRTKKSKIEEAFLTGYNHLSKNEVSLFLFLLKNSEKDSLKYNASFNDIRKSTGLSINTIKKCRANLKKSGVINFYKNENQATTYIINDLTISIHSDNNLEFDIDFDMDNDVSEFSNIGYNEDNDLTYYSNDSENEKSELIEAYPKAEKNITKNEYDLGFIDEEILPTVKCFLKYRQLEKLPFPQEKLVKSYFSYIDVYDGNMEIIENSFFNLMDISEYNQTIFLEECTDKEIIDISRFDLWYIADDLLPCVKTYILFRTHINKALSQKELDTVYVHLFLKSGGNLEEIKKTLFRQINSRELMESKEYICN